MRAAITWSLPNPEESESTFSEASDDDDLDAKETKGCDATKDDTTHHQLK